MIGKRTGKTHFEYGKIILVEIHIHVHPSRKLGNSIIFLDTRYTGSVDNLTIQPGRTPVITIGACLRNHHRQKSFAGNDGSIHVIKYETEIFLEFFIFEVRLYIGNIQLHLRISGIFILRHFGRIVPVFISNNIFQDGMSGIIAQTDNHFFQPIANRL